MTILGYLRVSDGQTGAQTDGRTIELIKKKQNIKIIFKCL